MGWRRLSRRRWGMLRRWRSRRLSWIRAPGCRKWSLISRNRRIWPRASALSRILRLHRKRRPLSLILLLKNLRIRMKRRMEILLLYLLGQLLEDMVILFPSLLQGSMAMMKNIEEKKKNKDLKNKKSVTKQNNGE